MIINTGFAFYLTLAVVLTGVIVLLDKFIFKKKREASGAKMSWIVDYSRALFPVLLIVWLVRSFLVQLYRVPTGSLEPTVMPGDWVLVNQFKYGLHLPITNTEILPINKPKRGDIVLFYYPPNPQIIYIKRMIGLPGDHIEYKNKILYVNGKKAPQTFLKKTIDYGSGPGQERFVNLYRENLLGKRHDIYVQPVGGETGDYDLTVPPNQYFVMGDNRDNSSDSRDWGFVPAANLIGKGEYIVFSWDPVHHRIRWNRMGDSLNPTTQAKQTND